MGSTLTGKNLLPSQGNRFFPFRVDPFWKGFVVQGSKQEVTRVMGIYEGVTIHLNTIALRKAKIVCNFGLSEWNRGNGIDNLASSD